MKKLLVTIAVVILVFGYAYQYNYPVIPGVAAYASESDAILESAYRNRQTNLQVQGKGIVTRILPDDQHGSRHQRFILKTGTGQTLLVAHNIDLAPRINEIKEGDMVEFFGEYEWNSKGGVIHWTHHDPAGKHVEGWLKHNGRIYR